MEITWKIIIRDREFFTQGHKEIFLKLALRKGMFYRRINYYFNKIDTEKQETTILLRKKERRGGGGEKRVL